MTSITHTPDAEVVLARLHTMRSDLLAQIAQQRGGTVSRAEMATDHFAHSEDTPADTNTARDLEFALNERETEELGAIDAALLRLHSGHYGQCVDCADAIAPARLKATPEVSRCMPCQEKFEHKPT
jgi:DnaK suppressor protein